MLRLKVVNLIPVVIKTKQQIRYFMKKHSSSTKKYYSVLIGAALLAASLFQFSRPVFSAGTEAGTRIRNTATGSYEDEGGKQYTTESNTVDVTVARVAGITNIPGTIDNISDPSGRILTGNRLSFNFEITNVGNDASDIFIPRLGDITTSGLRRRVDGENQNNLVIQVSPPLDADGNRVDNGNPFSFDDIPDGNVAIPQSRPDNGTVADVPANGKVLVRVTGTVTATGQGSAVEVLLGNTGTHSNDGTIDPSTQNQPDTVGGETGGEANDVRTAGQTTNTGNGALVGGEKEASALNDTVLGSNPLAMVYVGKTRGERTLNTNSLQDDIIPYSLKFEVRGNSESPIFTAGDLEGRDFSSGNADTGNITGTGITDGTNNTNLILVSDAIPEFTNLAAAPTDADVPTNWTPVYTEDPLGTLPTDANWTTDVPQDAAALARVTRIGWIYDAGANGAIPAGTTNIDPFNFTVVTAELPPEGGTIANIAQAFGTTDDGTAGTTAGTVVFDESGDQDASNFTGENRGPDENDPLSTGVADPATHGEDEDNNNTGDPASPGGEDNTLTIGQPGELVNGPNGEAGATGNIFGRGPNNQHDFQNLGVNADEQGNPVTARPGATFDPQSITFNNTFSYPESSGAPLTDVKLQPIHPDFGNIGGQNDFVPEGTTVVIRYNGNTATYTYGPNPDPDGSGLRFNLTSNSGDAIEFPSLAPGSSIDYEVVVNLPTGTDFSTNINRGFPIPIVAFTDSDPEQDGVPDLDTTNTFISGGNVTVNQIYTGFVKIVKQVRVLDPNGNVRTGMDFNDPDTSGTGENVTTAKQPRPGDILEYRVIYRNISEPQSGNNSNVVLNGVDVNIDENGTAAIVDNINGNNWALDNDNNGTLDTLHVPGEVRNSRANTTINYYSGESSSNAGLGELTDLGTSEPANTDRVTGYRTTVPSLPPAGAEAVLANPYEETVDAGDFTFTFQRKVEGFEFESTSTEASQP